MVAWFDLHNGILQIRDGMPPKDGQQRGMRGIQCTASEAEQDDRTFG